MRLDKNNFLNNELLQQLKLIKVDDIEQLLLNWKGNAPTSREMAEQLIKKVKVNEEMKVYSSTHKAFKEKIVRYLKTLKKRELVLVKPFIQHRNLTEAPFGTSPLTLKVYMHKKRFDENSGQWIPHHEWIKKKG